MRTSTPSSSITFRRDSMKLEFTVKGDPQGKGRPRFTRIGKPYTPENTASYEEKVRLAYWEQCGMEMAAAGIPLTLEITAVFGVPERFSKAVRQKMLAWEIRTTKRRDKYGCVRCQRYGRRTPATTVHHHRTDLSLTLRRRSKSHSAVRHCGAEN